MVIVVADGIGGMVVDEDGMVDDDADGTAGTVIIILLLSLLFKCDC